MPEKNEHKRSYKDVLLALFYDVSHFSDSLYIVILMSLDRDLVSIELASERPRYYFALARQIRQD